MPPSSPAPRGGLRVATIAGVQLVADWSLLLIFALIVVNLGAGAFPVWHPDWSPLTSWSTAMLAGVLFLASVAAHEMSHALMARRHGIPIRRITLFLFGGMAHMEKEPQSAKAEFWMAIVGPLASLAIGAAALLAGSTLVAGSLMDDPSDPGAALAQASPLATLLLWLGPVNILLALFNMLPGFPLDGGRVFRALLWWGTGDLDRATRWAGAVGQAFAWALMATGVSMAFGAVVPILGGGLVQGLWLLLIGWFLNNAARASVQQQAIRRAFEKVRVADVMRADLHPVPPSMLVITLVDDYLLGAELDAVPVIDDDRLVGLIDVAAVRRVDRRRWGELRVGDVMIGRDELLPIEPDEDAAEALGALGQRSVVPVVGADGRLRGLLSRQDLLRWLALRGDQAWA